MPAAPAIFILTGAGISAESGIPTFRDKGGWWDQFSPEILSTAQGFRQYPDRFWEFYQLRLTQMHAAQPNAAHRALARLQNEYPGTVTLVTQNVDDLHERAGSREVIHIHGSLSQLYCTQCMKLEVVGASGFAGPDCRHCGQKATLRPAIVWFGEQPYHLPQIHKALRATDCFAAIGTSGEVYPAAGFVQIAQGAGASALVELNAAPTSGSHQFNSHRHGLASVEVPRWVDEVLARAANR